MKQKLILFLTFICCIWTAKAQIEEPVQWKGSVKAVGDDQYELVMTGTIENGWHVYDMGPYEGGPNATVVTFEPNGDIELLGPVEAGKTEKKYDNAFGMDIGYYAGQAVFTQRVKALKAGKTEIKATIEWQACTDMNCLPPDEHEFTFVIDRPTDAAAPAGGTETEPAGDETPPAGNESPATPAAVSESAVPTGEIVQLDAPEKSMWSIIIEAILWGFAALLTPCVFPMVPMTVSFFLKSSDNKAKGRTLASFYGLSIIALYTLPIAAIILVTYLVGGDAVTADIFNWLSTHWLPNVVFFLIFMIFAASFFGAFEIVLPSKLVNRSDAKADKGGLIGTFFMALTLVLVSFSCTGPIVGSILVKSTQGEVWEPIITMLVFSTAFAIPFTLFAFFPSLLKNLPKSGGWLNSVKVVLGFIELALGLKFLSVADQTYHWGLLDREVYIALWIVIFTLLGFYLLGKLKFAHDSDEPYIKVKRLFLAIITFSFVVYLIPGMFGAPLKALSGYLPPMHTLDFNLSQGTGAVAAPQEQIRGKYSDMLHLPHGLQGFFDYKEGMEYARKAGKPVFLDFTGHGCVNCREMEANVWSDPQVLSILKNDYVIIALYVDDKVQLPESEWVTGRNGKTLKTLGKINAEFQAQRFGVNGQPYYVLLDNEGETLLPPRGYDLNVESYVRFLQEGLARYKARK